MNGIRKQLRLGVALIIFSIATYFIHYLIFRDPHHIFIYMVGDIAFVFIEVLLVTLIIHKFLEDWQLKERLEKLNTLVGAFFSEMGTELLAYFSDLDPNLDSINRNLMVSSEWTEKEFEKSMNILDNYRYNVEPSRLQLESLKAYICDKRGFLLRMLENPNMMEHEDFTELMRALFHLSEELRFRDELDRCPLEDIDHLANDIDRAYSLLVREWIAYMRHLKGTYPYLFSLAMRINPFNKGASVTIGV